MVMFWCSKRGRQVLFVDGRWMMDVFAAAAAAVVLKWWLVVAKRYARKTRG
jgi:hypothetical protein